jgi:hypothetical protein
MPRGALPSPAPPSTFSPSVLSPTSPYLLSETLGGQSKEEGQEDLPRSSNRFSLAPAGR